ncbi:MAG: hypothetical protein DRP65_04925 [Planctomycetota bacterium]|nr:MAG: hypothetical protein DRP65_04925 [Planctomycetota bacterium]
MYIQTQFSVFMVNKPGVLAQVLTEIAGARINLIAITMMDSVEHGVMRLVGRSPNRIRTALKGLNMPFSETEVLCVTLSNRAGALADITQKLAQAHINISYAYCTAGAKGGKTTGVLKVADVKKAVKVLASHADKAGKSKPTVRRSPASRR